MKFSHILYSVTCCFALYACADDDSPMTTEPGHSTSSAQGAVYLNLAVSAAANDDFTGENYEWDHNNPTGNNNQKDKFYIDTENGIINGTVYVFKGSLDRESEAVCVAKGDLGSVLTESVVDGQFSTRPVSFRNIPLGDFELEENAGYLALVVLNANDDFKGPDVERRQTFGDWAKTLQSSDMRIKGSPFQDPTNNKMYDRYYLTMTNGTGMTGWSGSTTYKPVTLAPISPQDISKTPFADNETAYTKIFVQRNVAKINVIPVNLNFENKSFPFDGFTVQINLLNWDVDVANLKTFPVLNVDGLDWSRSFTHGGDAVFNRVFWGKDHNYDKDNVSADFYRTPNGNGGDVRYPQYVLENTFDKDHMLRSQTTRVVFVCRWVWDSRDVNSGLILSTLPDGYGEGENDFNENGLYVLEKTKVRDQKHLSADITTSLIWMGYKAEDIVLTWKTKDLPGGYYTLGDLVDVKVAGETLSDTDFAKVETTIGLTEAGVRNIAFHKNLYMYYTAIIRHYSDSDEGIAWNPSTQIKEGNGKMVAAYNDSHLGRYGVVRNNYYVVNVTGITGMGEPMIPETPEGDTDDMPDEQRIAVEVSVLAWKKHSNSYDL